MTDDPSNDPRVKFHAGLKPWFDAWKTSTQNVLSQVSGQRETFELALEPIGAADSDLRYTVAATGAVHGEMALRVSVASAIRLSRKFLGAIATSPEPPAGGAAATVAITNDDKEALEELLRQIAGVVSTSVGSVVGGEVQLQLSLAEAPWAASADAMAAVRSRDETGAGIAIEIRLSPAFAGSLAARLAASAPETSSQSASAQIPASPPPAGAAGYQRLFGVGLGVKLRFGTRRMLLRDVLALSTGLVVELENALDSPVDLLLDGRVIARGDVVVIDGKYGLRVTEVVDSAPGNAARSH